MQSCLSRCAAVIAMTALLAACRPKEEKPPAAARGGTAARGGPAGEPRFEAAFGTDKANAFTLPVWFGEVPGKPDHYLVLERGDGRSDARIWVLVPGPSGHARKVFLTVPVSTSTSPADERGLLGFAFHPRFPENRRYFVYYMPRHAPARGRDSTVIDMRHADSTLLADAGLPPRRVLGIAQPFPNHNGGGMGFGPDGFLYVGTGDGGAADDPFGNGQDLKTLLGKMLRLDVDAGGAAYGIPKDNPYASGRGPGGKEARPEIWAHGLRNPWRWSFDPKTGDLWAGDVGQNRKEEITRISKGDNLGWNVMEGFDCFEPAQGCDRNGLRLPETELPRDEAQSMTGGFVYRGDPSSPWYGAYFFGDYETRNFYALPPGHRPGDPPRKLGRSPDQPSSFGVDRAGNLYLVGYRKGAIYRIALPK